MSLNLVVYRNIGSSNLAWNIEDNYYTINSLQKFEPIIQSIKWTIPINISRLTSKPLFVFTQTEWVILMIQDENIIIYDQMSSQSLNQNTRSIVRLNSIPDMSQYNNQSEILDSIELSNLIINPLNQDGNSILLDGFSLSDAVPPLQRAIFEEETIIENNISASYEVLLKQLYNLPITLPDNFVSFEQISQMLSSGQIKRFILDPELQPYAGNPSSPNRILTMFDNNGMTYLVRSRYDQTTNQIFAPV